MTHSGNQPMRKPGPQASPLSQPFWEGCRERRLLIQYCPDSEKWVFYPRALDPHSWSTNLQWREASGRGTVASFIVVHKPGHPAFVEDSPYVVALIDLQEGPRMLSNVVECAPDAVRIGMPVQVHWVEQGGEVLPKFRPADPRDNNGE
ncbi:Zn-ribbon domain-containing OB-fold protein [Alloalcanivorax mobilis]|uniref:Zn-ribbon domain-containing OB-fold protein n=1 Tax=Alloalcanivorax mobilis TaxID=2019569 RepID=UPI000C78AD3F|nr:OB-fold domain-containing protein [Alloalcanivorax mobilis]